MCATWANPCPLRGNEQERERVCVLSACGASMNLHSLVPPLAPPQNLIPTDVGSQQMLGATEKRDAEESNSMLDLGFQHNASVPYPTKRLGVGV
mmetsp:Transcript_28570/g.55746  ORF Transcript_28570/g.55746 Transcript_28570/m.55746 type:complete len:94 (+) Transcript_28570:95-376(+)